MVFNSLIYKPNLPLLWDLTTVQICPDGRNNFSLYIGPYCDAKYMLFVLTFSLSFTLLFKCGSLTGTCAKRQYCVDQPRFSTLGRGGSRQLAIPVVVWLVTFQLWKSEGSLVTDLPFYTPQWLSYCSIMEWSFHNTPLLISRASATWFSLSGISIKRHLPELFLTVNVSALDPDLGTICWIHRWVFLNISARRPFTWLLND